jgi:hypothetical protein
MKLWIASALILLAPLAGCGGGGSPQNKVAALSIPPDKPVVLPLYSHVSINSSGTTTLAIPADTKNNFPLLPPVSGDPLERYTTDTLDTWIRQSLPTDFTPSKVPANETLPLTTTFLLDGYLYRLTNQELDSNLTIFNDETSSTPIEQTPLYFDILNSAYVSHINGGELIAIGNRFPYSCPQGTECKPQFKFYNPKLQLEWVPLNSSAAGTPQKLSYDGRFLASAQSEDQLVIVSAYEADIKTPYTWPLDSTETRQLTLSKISTQDYVAMIDGTPSTVLADACYTSGDMMDFALGTAINMTTIDLRTHSIVGNTCLLSDITSISVSDTAIAVQLPNGTVHEFAMDAGVVTYAGAR